MWHQDLLLQEEEGKIVKSKLEMESRYACFFNCAETGQLSLLCILLLACRRLTVQGH
jgi:hypothetical protein